MHNCYHSTPFGTPPDQESSSRESTNEEKKVLVLLTRTGYYPFLLKDDFVFLHCSSSLSFVHCPIVYPEEKVRLKKGIIARKLQ